MLAEYSPRDLNGIFIDFPSNVVATTSLQKKKKNIKDVGSAARERNLLSLFVLHAHYGGVLYIFFLMNLSGSYVSYSN